MNEDQSEHGPIRSRVLLTIFFVGVVLCGVFFALGYVIGNNSAKQPLVSAVPAESGSTVSEGKRTEPGAEGASGESTPVPSAEPQIRDNVASAGAHPATGTATEPAPPAPAPAPAPVAAQPVAPPATPPPPVTRTGVEVSTPEAGASYLQVAALTRPAADTLVKTFRDHALPAILTASSKPDVFRVMVGPYRSTLSLSDAKKKLKTLGFSDPQVHTQ